MTDYHAIHIYKSGKQWEKSTKDKDEAIRWHKSGLRNPLVVRAAVDEYDTHTDPFDPHWRTIIDVDKTIIGKESIIGDLSKPQGEWGKS